VQHFASAKRFFAECAAPELTSEAAALLDEHEQKIRSKGAGPAPRAGKDLLYEARYYGRTSSARLYTGSGKKSGFTKKPTVEEQLNENPATEQESSGEEGKPQD
jgi:hypothetical protein